MKTVATLPAMKPVQLDKGAFVISFDFELAWGTRGRPSARTVGPFLDGTRRAIDGILALFEKYEISATWVVVGGMFLGGATRHPWISGQEYGDIPQGDEDSQPHWYARDILQKILACRTPQEIGCHTLTHMLVDETEATRQRFDWELARSVELFAELNLPRPRSFIYPKHYMAHFDLLRKHGFTCFRGPEMGWWERLPTAATRGIARLVSQRLRERPVVGLPAIAEDGLVMIPSSQYYPGFHSVGKYVSVQDRVARAIKGIKNCIIRKKVYHIWTHPFNLGIETANLLDGIEAILRFLVDEIESDKIQQKTMTQLAGEIA